jgi:hypothetical protein
MSWSPPTRPARRDCEIDRAFRELIGRPWVEAAGSGFGCSPDSPEARDFPVSPGGGPKYGLCNGHLRDIFEALGHRPTTLAPPAAT